PAIPLDLRPIIHPGSFEVLVIQFEAERFDEMECRVRGRTQARHVACVRRDFRFNQDQVHASKFRVQSPKLKRIPKSLIEVPSSAWLFGHWELDACFFP